MKINLLIWYFLREARCGSKPHLPAWGLPKYFLKLHKPRLQRGLRKF